MTIASQIADDYAEMRRLREETASLRARLAASDLERIRLRAGLREALDLARRIALGDVDDTQARAEVAELRKLVTP